MAGRTYLPTLFKILLTLCSFITRYRTQIVKAVGEGNADKVDGVVLACNLLQDVVAPLVAPDADDPHI